MIRKPSKTFLLYLGTLSATGMVVLFLATSRMGPGVSTDSAMILATAENLLHGRGLIDYSANELTQFPPLYSIIQALGSSIFGTDVFVVGWILNLIVFGFVIWLTGRDLRDAFPEEPILAYLGSIVVLTSTSLIQISANIASDPLFMLMVILFLKTAAFYLKSGRLRDALPAAAITIVSCFQRYAGLALVITGSMIILWGERRHVLRALLTASTFALVTAAPIYAWGYMHNKPVNGTVFGARLPAVPTLNFVTGAEKVLYWFIPHRLIEAVGAVPLTAILIAACVLAIGITGWSPFLQKLARPHVAPHIAFLLVYGAVLVFNISYYELKGLETDRVHIIALPSLLIVMGAVASHVLEFAKKRLNASRLYGAVVALFLVWSIYPISRTNEYVRLSMVRGDVSSYNSINKSDVRHSEFAEFLHELELDGTALYSNGGDTAWFILRRLVAPSPMLRGPDREAELLRGYAGWPGHAGPAYLIWFRAEAHKTSYATPEELASVATLRQLYADGTGTVYSIESR